MSITPGENIGPYRIIEQLGSGGMATVYKAYHPALDRYVAVKIMHPAFKADPQFFERFQREARVVAKLEHPNIIPIYDFNEHQGEPYLVMRFVEGDTLKPRMESGPLSPAEILHLTRPVCQALAYAHQQGVLHRDIKPSNIMLSTNGDIFLTDFGLARMVQAGESTLSQDMLIGTPQYISPEQAQGLRDLDGRTDIYSLGVVLFEMLTGQVPFSADTPFATIHDHIFTPLPLPTTLNPNLDPAVERMLLKALAKEPGDRYATVGELLEGLEASFGAQLTTPPPVTPHVAAAPPVTTTPPAAAVVPPSSSPLPETTESPSPSVETAVDRPRKSSLPWWVWAGGTAAILVVLAGLLVALWLRRPTGPPPPAQPAPAQAGVGQPGQPAQPPPPPAGAAGPRQEQAADLTQQAGMAMQQRQPQEAIDLYNQALAADPSYLPAYFGLAEALRLGGDQAGSQAILEEAVAQNPDDPAAYRRLGENYLMSEEYEQALSTFEQAVALDPEDPALLAEQGIALLALDQDEAAKETIDAALQLDRLSPEARLANAMYLIKQRELRPAALTLRQLAQDARAPLFVQNRARRLLEEIRPE